MSSSKLGTFQRLWAYAESKGFQVHPDFLIIREGEDLNLNQARELMSRLQQERDKRVPAAVLENGACLACWSKESLALCSACGLWSLCNRCHTELEGNCFQCLFEDQVDKAKACFMRREPPAPASVPLPASTSASVSGTGTESEPEPEAKTS